MAAGADGSGEVRGRVLVIGAGPGGLATVIALNRVGVEAVAYERNQAFAKYGGGIGVQSNALRALMKLGIGDKIADSGVELRGQEICDIHGKPLLHFPIGEVADEYGTPTISTMRAKLLTTLADSLPEGSLVTGAECVDVRQDDDGVEAVFADGRTERGTVLIGADGGRSVVRRHVLGTDDAPPRYCGFTNWRAVVDSDAATDTARTFLGSGVQFVLFPVGDRKVYWGCMKVAPEGTGEGGPGTRDRLLADLDGFPAVCRELVGATPEEAVVHSDIYDRDPDTTWVRGRVAILGDAAHLTTPFVGQGAGIAMEDAIALAKELSLTSGLRDQRMINDALLQYERARKPRCSQVVLSSRKRGNMFAISNPAFVTVRNAVFRRMPKSFWRKQIEQTNSYNV